MDEIIKNYFSSYLQTSISVVAGTQQGHFKTLQMLKLLKFKSRYTQQAYIHKMVEEKKSIARDLKRKKFVSALSTEIISQVS